MNDPNGLVWHDGWWHLFFQHHPHSLQWGPMHWGHARSRNLVAWEHLPIALAPGPDGTAFSGSAVVDLEDSAGFGPGALVATYTQDAPGSQVQALAGSVDGGITWTPYPANPVVAQPTDQIDFRDPKVVRFGDGWAMVLAVGRAVWLYTSKDLRWWSHVSTFTDHDASAWGTWETPDLFPLAAPSGEALWVLSIGMTTNGPTGGSGTWYRVGRFDGTSFTPCDDGGRWVDHGPDFYAAQSWFGTGDRRVWLGWMSSTAYSPSTPAVADPGGGAPMLAQHPALEGGVVMGTFRCDVGERLSVEPAYHRAVVVTARFGGAARLTLDATTASGDAVQVHVDGALRRVTTERSGPAASAIDGFACRCSAAVPGEHDFDVTVVIDAGTVEVFAGNGTAVISMLHPSRSMPTVNVSGLAVATASIVSAGTRS
jgi:sucrose-6-phosphate hydrolase SacC (GH32 family)